MFLSKRVVLLFACLSCVLLSKSFVQGLNFTDKGWIYCNDTKYSSISSNEVDGYYFSADSNYSMIQFTTCSSSFDSVLYILNTSMSVVAYNDDNCSNNDAVITGYYIPEGTSFYVAVGGYNASEYGNYTLTATCVYSFDYSGSNYSNYSNATTTTTSPYKNTNTTYLYQDDISCGEMVYGSIGMYGINIYSFNYTDSYPGLRISTCNNYTEFDTVLYLYNSTMGLIKECDDCGGCSPQSILTQYYLSTGMYYIGVDGYDAYEYGNYSLNVSCGYFYPTPSYSYNYSYSTTGVGDVYLNWDCNHIYRYSLPVSCLYENDDDGRSFSAQCDQDGGVLISAYLSDDCSGDVNETEYWNSTDSRFTNGVVACSYDYACGYVDLNQYNDTTEDDCDGGNLLQSAPYVVDECYEYSNSSQIITCDDDGIYYMRYDCTSCDSDCLVNETDIVQMFENQGYCIQFVCNSTDMTTMAPDTSSTMSPDMSSTMSSSMTGDDDDDDDEDSDDGNRNFIGLISINVGLAILSLLR